MTQKYRALLKAAELQSMTRAAEELGYSLSAMSQIIRSLEEELGISLLLRRKNGVTLTAEGLELLPYFQQVVYSSDALLQRAQEIRGMESGTVRIGTFSSVASGSLPQFISAFSREHPGIGFQVRVGNYEEIHDMLRMGRVDFGIVLPGPAVEGFCWEALPDAELVAVVPEEHPLSELERIPLEKLAEYPLVLLQDAVHYEPLAALRRTGRKPQVRGLMQDDYGLMALVEQGLGVSILAKSVTEHSSYRVKIRPLEPPLTGRLAVVYPDRDLLPTAAKRFIQLLQNA